MTRTCKDCKRPLDPADALICVVCESYQDWRRWLPAQATTLSLLVALISVTTALTTVLQKAVQSTRSEINVTFLRTRHGSVGDHDDTFVVEALVANTGKETGLVRSFYLGFVAPVECKTPVHLRRCGEGEGGLLGSNYCELVYTVNGEANQDAPTTRLLRPGRVEVAGLHFLDREASRGWNSIKADIVHSDGRAECLEVDTKGVGE